MKHRASYRMLDRQLALMRALHIGEQQAMVLQAVLMGLAGACAALLFELGSDAVQWLCTGFWGGRVACWMQLSAWQRVLIPCLGAIPAALVLWWALHTDRHHVPDYMESFSLGNGRLPRGQGILRSLSAVLTLGTGCCIGKEGALIQISSVAASATGRWLNVSAPRLRLMVGCGAAAGMTAAFHTPLAACLFVCEVVVGSFSITFLGPLLIASCTSYALLWLLGMNAALFSCEVSFRSLGPMLGCALLAALMGPLGRLWVLLLNSAQRLLSGRPRYLVLRMTAAGLLAGLAALWQPAIVGNGQEAVAALIAGHFPVSQVAALLVLKVLVVAVVFGVGTMGGVLTPTLMIGCFGGYLFGVACSASHELCLAYALIGMAAFFTASARTPVTALILLIEFTMEAELIFPLMLAVAVAYGVARLLPGKSLYDRTVKDESVYEGRMSGMRVQHIMRPCPARLRDTADEESILRAALRHPGLPLPVVDGQGALMGLLPANGTRALPVSPLHPGDDLPAALRSFEQQTEWPALPVVNADGIPLGMVSRTELFQTTALLMRRELAEQRANV